MKKELQKPCMIRIKDSLKAKIKESADKNNDGNFNKEIRELIEIGLKNKRQK